MFGAIAFFIAHDADIRVHGCAAQGDIQEGLLQVTAQIAERALAALTETVLKGDGIQMHLHVFSLSGWYKPVYCAPAHHRMEQEVES